MPHKIGFILALLFLMIPTVWAGDLFLLKIDSYEQLDLASEEISYAHGLIGERFIVELTEDQADRLRNYGLDLKFIASAFNPANYALVGQVDPAMTKEGYISSVVFSNQSGAIITLNARGISELREEGLNVVSLENIKTPLFYNAPLKAATNLLDVPSDSLADLVIQDSLYAYDTRLEDFRTRYIYSDSILAARDYIVAKFNEFGYEEVQVDLFYHNGWPCYNIYCVKPGTVEQDKVIVIGGHYDSINGDSDPSEFAPGADDNASGTAATMELARIFSQVETKKTMIFAAFSAEEVGLVGSYFMAEDFYNQGMDIEFMMNFDMVAYEGDAIPNVSIYNSPFPGYAQVIADSYTRLGELDASLQGWVPNSDHASFVNFGYHAAYIQEGDFNFDGWHTDLDLSSRLDFAYFTKVVRGAAAAVGFVDNAAATTNLEDIYDVGDGQGLRIAWSNCYNDYTYTILYGTESGVYTDTANVPNGMCQFDLTGLTPNTTYYVTVRGVNSEGYGPIELVEDSLSPLVNPRIPNAFTASPDSAKIELAWNENKELDLSHYQLHRRTYPDGDWEIYADNLTDTVYTDFNTASQTLYEYKVVAFDGDMNQSGDSELGIAAAATFDGGTLLVDQYDTRGNDPTFEELDNYYGAIMNGLPYTQMRIGNFQDTSRASRSILGQYNTVVWLDDDWTHKMLEYSTDSLEWFLSYETNLFMAGYYTLYWQAGSLEQSEGDFVYDQFGITRVDQEYSTQFLTAEGYGPWPDITVDPDGLFGPTLYDVATLNVLPEAQVIYTFKSPSGNTPLDGLPIGVAYSNGSARAIALTVPLYYMDYDEANAMMQKAMEYFAGGILYLPGDYDGNGLVNVIDILMLADFVFENQSGTGQLNAFDVNGDCDINIADIMYLVEYKFLEGQPPQEGCYE